jgi:hypothetical protein
VDEAGGQHVLVRHEDERIVRALEADAILECSDKVPQMERTRRPITCKQPRRAVIPGSDGFVALAHQKCPRMAALRV